MRPNLLVAALLTLGIANAGIDFGRPPDSMEQQKVLADATAYAESHEASLPNFTCTQTTRRFENVNDMGWRPIDVILERLAYFEHREVYQMITPMGRSVDIGQDTLRGMFSSGEFGSMIKAIFSRQTEARFRWSHWSTLRAGPVYVYAYVVFASRSAYMIQLPARSVDLATGYHGLVYIDTENHFVRRITLHADDIPKTVPLQDVSLTLDYDYRRIGDADHLLPFQFELVARVRRRLLKNLVSFEGFHKFDAVSVIGFDSPEGIRK